MSSSVYVDNKGKDILILGEGLTEGLDDSTLTAKANILLILHNQEKHLYWVNTTVETTVSYLLMLQKYISSKQNMQK